MPWDKVMGKWKAGQLHSGSSTGPLVHNRSQAIAIEISEKKKAQAGHREYQPQPNRKQYGGNLFA